jgi:hypothetical protein
MTYCLSSYVIWFHSSALKESLLVMLILAFYASYYGLILDKKPMSLWGVILMPILILLFRPVLSIFCLLSVTLTVVLKRKLSVPQLIFLFLVVFAGIFYLEPLINSTDKFLLGGTKSMLEIKEIEGMVKGSVSFTYVVNSLSSMFGPFPTLASVKTHLCFYAPGLIFKILLSVIFWFGLIEIVKKREYLLYPMLIFIMLEIGSLTYILEALELRKSLPHFALIYIVAFMFIFNFDHRQLNSLKSHLFYKKSFNLIAFFLCVLMIYWNFR